MELESIKTFLSYFTFGLNYPTEIRT